MRKLRLDLESLEVCSFETALPEREDGTVRGNYLDSRADCDSTRIQKNCFCSIYCPTETCPSDAADLCFAPTGPIVC